MRTVKRITLSCLASLLVATSPPASASLSSKDGPSTARNQPMHETPPPPPTPPRPVSPPPILLEPATSSAQTELPVSQARAASPRNERRWTQRILNAYPSRAKREGIEGTVGVRVTVTPQGRGSNCQTTSSSGSKLLDEAACKGMERFARFNPALDRAGTPTRGSFSTRITYVLGPGDMKREEPVARAPSTEDWALEEAKMEAELAKHRGGTKEYDEALAWLDATKPFTQASSSGDGSAVVLRGFIDQRQLTAERLEALNQGSIKPNLLLADPDKSSREPIQIIRSKLQAGVPEHCVLLLQVHRRDGAQDLGDLTDKTEGGPYYAPSFTLGDDCKINTPWAEGTKLGEPFEWNETISFIAEGGHVRIDENLSCGGLEDITSERFTLSTFATVQTEFFTNLPVNSDKAGWLSHLNAMPFGVVSRFFVSGVKRAEPRKVRGMNLVFDPFIVGDANDIFARFSILNDDEADEFCIVTRAEQNASVFQRILRMPRDGRRLHWDPARTTGSLTNSPEIRDFAKSIGAEFRALASVEPNS